MVAAPFHSISRREFLTFLYKYRARISLAFLLPFALFIALSFIPTPRYEASSVLIIRLGSEYVYQPVMENSNGPTPVVPFDRDQIFKSEAAILGSEDLHAQVIRMIGLDTLYPELAHPTGVAWFIAAARDGIAAALENSLSEQEKKEWIQAKALELFDKRLDIFLEKESAVIRVTFAHKDRAVAIRALDTLMTLYFEKRKSLFMTPYVALAAAEAEDKRRQMSVANRAVEDFKRQHRLYSLAEERSRLLDRRSAALEQAAVVSSDAIWRKIAAYNGQLDRLDAMEGEFERLQSEASIARAAYNLYSGKLDQAQSLENIERQRADSVRVIQAPSVPPEPKRLQGLILLARFFISLLSALGVAAYTEFCQSGFLTPEQIERSLLLPVIGIFPLQKRA